MSGALDPADRAHELARIFSDRQAFDRWYEGALVKVYSYLFARCGGDANLAEDLAQQTFIQAVRRRETYDGRADAITWLCAIARNKLADHHRELHRAERRHLRLVVREISVDDHPTPEAAMLDRDAVLSALRGLPALQRAAVVLCYIDGLSVRQASVALGRSESATESLLSRAREKLRATLGEPIDE